MNQQPAPTPETDNHSLLFRTAGVGYAYGHLLPLARKLERERDEARRDALNCRQIIDTYSRQEDDLIKAQAERDQLRKVLREMTDKYRSEMIMMFGHAADCDCSRCMPYRTALAAYNELAHVKGKE